ncbi:hypothetical protein CBOM_07232 [Ceraceosorus bombacis]|uniref:Uncharacterized protein n=1 Tax=Ceraceosorus bombacis TaxID=401625 RepID=A0A0P1B8Z4_9BASI|nr:hypothetical protein CBOM_07232 [Ceraceosorus bombacis]
MRKQVTSPAHREAPFTLQRAPARVPPDRDFTSAVVACKRPHYRGEHGLLERRISLDSLS